jgi:hypothetical protein
MFSILHALAPFIADLAKSCSRLEAENLLLRHQLNVALRKAPADPRLRNCDRAILVWLIQLWPNLLGAVGFRAFWSWKSKSRAGRPKIHRTLRDLIQRMYRENPLWGAPRIHGELLMLGIEVAQTKVSKYMMRGCKPPLQNWKTFLRIHDNCGNRHVCCAHGDIRLVVGFSRARHQVMVLRRQARGKIRLTNLDRLFLVPALPLDSVDPTGPRHRSVGDGHSLASDGL